MLELLRLRRRPDPDPTPHLAQAHAAEQLAATRERWPEVYLAVEQARRALRST